MSEPGSFYVRALKEERDKLRKAVVSESSPRERRRLLARVKLLERAADLLFLGNVFYVASLTARTAKR